MPQRKIAVRLAGTLLALLLGLGAGGCRRKATGGARGYNLLVITLDTTRADRIGAYGYARALTPNIDELCRQGARAADAYTSVPLTLPSHTTIFTGRYPIGHGVRNNGTYRLGPGLPTLAETLRGAGYRTYAVVAAYTLMAKFGLARGFDQYDDSLDARELVADFNSEIPADRVWAKFHGWLERAPAGPFFAWVHFYDPHLPYYSHPEYRERLGSDESGRYDGEVAYMDRYVGAVLADLKERQLLDRTLVALAGDHGEDLGEHQEHGHGIFCYQESLRVPLILWQPRLIRGGRVIGQRLNLADLAPTLLELLGAAAPAGMQGESFAARLTRDLPETPRSFYLESLYGKEDMNWAPLTGFIDDHLKFISLPQPELYDLAADPGERVNLFLRRNAQARELDRKLRDFLGRYGQGAPAGTASSRGLSEEDRRHLQALGYISSFGSARAGLDPKQGVVVQNRLRDVLLQVENKRFAAAAAALAAVRRDNGGLEMPLLDDLDFQVARGLGREREARAILVRASARFPDSDMFPMRLAKFDLENGDAAAAEQTARALLARRPDFTQGYVLLARIAEEGGRKGEAAALLDRAVDGEPDNVLLKIACADLHIAVGDHSRALALYESLLDNVEVRRSADILFKIALFEAQHGDLGRAEELLRQTTVLAPSGKHFYNYALVLFKDNKIDAALASMRAARERFSDQLSAEQREMADRAIASWQDAR
jgi:arylsulfatase A-like enzyme